MATLLVSDLHLSAERPAQRDLFLAFAEHACSTARALYILGDLFEVWLGDDDDTPPHPQVIEALKRVSEAGVELSVGHGNRDFLFGRRFERATGARLMADYEVIDLCGQRTLYHIYNVHRRLNIPGGGRCRSQRVNQRSHRGAKTNKHEDTFTGRCIFW